MSTRIPDALRSTVLAGLAVMLLDGLDAVIYFPMKYGITVAQLFQSIASAVLGRSAFSSGWKAVCLGVILHGAVAFIVTLIYVAIYFAVSGHSAVLAKYFWISGPIYGVAVYLTMEFIVLPLTAQAHSHRGGMPHDWINEVFAHVFLVGLPIAWIVQRDGREGVRGAA